MSITDKEKPCPSNLRRSYIYIGVFSAILLLATFGSIGFISLAVDTTIKINFDVNEVNFTPDKPILFSENTTLYASSDNATFEFESMGFLVIPAYIDFFFETDFYFQIDRGFYDLKDLDTFENLAFDNKDFVLSQIRTYTNESFSIKIPSDYIIGFVINVKITYNESVSAILDAMQMENEYIIQFVDLALDDYHGRSLLHGTVQYDVESVTYASDEIMYNYWNFDNQDSSTYTSSIDLEFPYLLNNDFKSIFWIFALFDTFREAEQI